MCVYAVTKRKRRRTNTVLWGLLVLDVSRCLGKSCDDFAVEGLTSEVLWKRAGSQSPDPCQVSVFQNLRRSPAPTTACWTVLGSWTWGEKAVIKKMFGDFSSTRSCLVGAILETSVRVRTRTRKPRTRAPKDQWATGKRPCQCVHR